MRSVLITTLAAALTCGAAAHADTAPPVTGPVITGYGPHYPVAAPGFATITDSDYRVVFDVARSDQDADTVNPRIETAARFLNMHAANGVNPARMRLALVIHGAAAGDVLSDSAYKQRNGIANPNAPLIAQLADAGVEFIVCGQTAAYRGFSAEEFAPNVKQALSAMTALVTLQNNGYALIQF